MKSLAIFFLFLDIFINAQPSIVNEKLIDLKATIDKFEEN